MQSSPAAAESAPSLHGPTPHTGSNRLPALALAALGVVYGDIGTSPLYAMRECFHGPHGFKPDPTAVLGVLSLILWSLILIICVKYVGFVLRADNKGEGGILSLMALVCKRDERERSWKDALSIGLALFGAALLYGDGMITPAISVLSAVEGLQVATPFFQPYVLPITVAILIGFFAFQHKGTTKVGRVFGPILLVWFASLALLGIAQIVQHPAVLWAINPYYIVQFFAEHGWPGMLVLGPVVLVVTGGEALYADMGHFGRTPIRLAWFTVVFPALVLTYLGQGALLLRNPEAAAHPFFYLVPGWALYPMVVLSTVAAVIASQALVSGAFSLTHQAVQLGYLPRVRIKHTSAHEMGQIYIPEVNYALMVATIALVLSFGTSSNLAAAYGIAVTATMAMTSLLLFRAMRELWGWPLPVTIGLAGFFLATDLAFFSANVPKITAGGWVPLVIGAMIYVILSTWSDGRRLLADRLRETARSLDDFLQEKGFAELRRVPGTAVFLAGHSHGVPPALVQNLRHNKVLHDEVLLLTIFTQPVPHVSEDERVEVEDRGSGIYRVRVHYGFLDHPDVPKAVAAARRAGVPVDPEEVTYFAGMESLYATHRPGMALWRERLFVLLARNSHRATQFFRVPTEQLIEIGVRIEL